MTVGGLSLDPRRVIAADTEYVRGRYILTVRYLVAETVVSLDTCFDDAQEAGYALAKLDEHCYKGPLADAIATQTIDDDDDDDDDTEGKGIGFDRS